MSRSTKLSSWRGRCCWATRDALVWENRTQLGPHLCGNEHAFCTEDRRAATCVERAVFELRGIEGRRGWWPFSATLAVITGNCVCVFFFVTSPWTCVCNATSGVYSECRRYWRGRKKRALMVWGLPRVNARCERADGDIMHVFQCSPIKATWSGSWSTCMLSTVCLV